jgi:uncharacterized SAM-binding protein YcdF (DUF218 family)
MILRLFAYCFTALVTLCLLWILGWLWFAAETVSAKPQDELVKSDAIIVLTGGDKRIAEGLDLIARGAADKIFISGVNEKVGAADIVALWDGEANAILPKISLGYRAEDTASNATESHEWIRRNDVRSIRLVTANYHMARSYFVFHQAMPNLTIHKHPVIPDDFEPWGRDFWTLTFTEYNKFLAAWLHRDLYNKNPSLVNINE